MCIAHREPRYSSITTIGTTFHIQHRSIQTKVNTAPHTTTQELKTPSAQRSASNTEAYRQKSTPHPTPQPKNSKLPRHNVPHPIPKHTDKSQHRITHHNPRTQNPFGTTFHIQYRSIQTKVNTVSHTTTQELLKKSPRGVQRGRGFTAPLRFFHSFPKQKNQALCQESKTKTKTQSHNKQRKRIRKK